METLKWMAKAITAAGTAFIGAVAAYKLQVSPAVLVMVVTLMAGVSVFLVSNGEKPTE